VQSAVRHRRTLHFEKDVFLQLRLQVLFIKVACPYIIKTLEIQLVIKAKVIVRPVDPANVGFGVVV
jgi:hypothetical protein